MDAFIGLLGPLGTIIVGVLGYFYGKGRNAAKTQLRDRELSRTDKGHESRLKALEERTALVEKTIREIENALDRSYPTTKYCHENFPSKEIFDIKMDAVQDHITGKIDAVLQIIKIRREAE